MEISDSRFSENFHSSPTTSREAVLFFPGSAEFVVSRSGGWPRAFKGHEFGLDLSMGERQALIVLLKTL